jgi:hypothetical protein
LLRDDSIVLRSHVRDDACWLHLLRHDEQHARLLLLETKKAHVLGYTWAFRCAECGKEIMPSRTP